MLSAIAIGFQSQALLGGPEASVPRPALSNPGDWCDCLRSEPTTLYKSKDNPYLQSLWIGGRFQYQAAYLDGEDANGRDFNDTYDEYRRVRIESKTDFLRYFTLKAVINMVWDVRRAGNDLDWGYHTFDEAYLSFDIKEAFGTGALDSLEIAYGRLKFNMTEEVHMSSKEIYTVERSAIANKLYGSRTHATGATLGGSLGTWSATFGIFSGEDDSDFIGGWNDGRVYYFSAGYQHSETLRFVLDYARNDRSGTDDFLGYKWATALNAIYEDDRFGTLTTIVLGENNGAGIRGGSFHGLVVMPWYWVVEDRLQAVFQYQYSGASEDEGIRTNLRYVRSQHSPGVNVNGGRGDELHTFYAGLNYHICGDNAKIMTGIEYTTLDTRGGDVDAITYAMAFRMFF